MLLQATSLPSRMLSNQSSNLPMWRPPFVYTRSHPQLRTSRKTSWKKEDLSYELINHWPIDITNEIKTEKDVAYKTKDTKKPKCTEKNCDYCAKHHKKQNKLCTYHTCLRIKGDQEKNEAEENEKRKSEAANMARDDDVKEVVWLSKPRPRLASSTHPSSTKWICNTGCTVHMMNNYNL